MRYLDTKTLDFLLYRIFDLESIIDHAPFSEHDKESLIMFLESVKDFADQDLYPFFKEMDETPVEFKNGKVEVHPQIGVIMKKAGELCLINGLFEEKFGGLQLPFMVHTSAHYILESANNHAVGYIGLTLGAAELIAFFGSDTLIDQYVPKMLEGTWSGTMCLTEPQAGSSLSDITTTAFPQADGSYKIKGQKIFISGGDHEHVENIIHLVLARVKGAPAGTRGISLFVVPKYRKIEPERETNDVLTVGDFQKMGQKGYCTTHLIFGENEDCRAQLVGEPHQGLRYMFQMMNAARIAVGRGAAAIAGAAYQASLSYATERHQGRRIGEMGKKKVDEGQTLIINHPDVRRMLLKQKSISEGALALVLQAAFYHDKMKSSTEENTRLKYHMLLELLTPVVKTFPSEMGKESVDTGLQVLGGYGFCSEYILQQYFRDIRIFPIYEGTTGIQSLDLLGRKVLMNNGQAMMNLLAEVNSVLTKAATVKALEVYKESLQGNIEILDRVLKHLLSFTKAGKFEVFIADATVFMEMFGLILVSWQWLKMGIASEEILAEGGLSEEEIGFYQGKIQAMKYFFKYELVKASGCAEILMNSDQLTILEGSEFSW